MWKMWGDSIGKIGDAKKAQMTGDDDDSDHVGFEDADGIDEAKDRVREIVDFIRNPEKYQRLGARLPKGLLLVGPPGTGKTLLARAIANEAGVPFFYCSGSDFVEMFAGRGAARVQALFEKAERNSPSIVFVDEIDSLGKHRGDGVYSHEEREQTLNQMLACMDGFGTQNSRVVVIGATNRYDTLDRALTRPGRFDRIIKVPLPSQNGREAILRVHLRKVKHSVDIARIAEITESCSGAELENIVNEACISLARKDKVTCTTQDLEQAVEVFMESRNRRNAEDVPQEGMAGIGMDTNWPAMAAQIMRNL